MEALEAQQCWAVSGRPLGGLRAKRVAAHPIGMPPSVWSPAFRALNVTCWSSLRCNAVLFRTGLRPPHAVTHAHISAH